MVFWRLFSNESIQNILILSTTVAPFASAGIRPVVNGVLRPRILLVLLTLYGKSSSLQKTPASHWIANTYRALSH